MEFKAKSTSLQILDYFFVLLLRVPVSVFTRQLATASLLSKRFPDVIPRQQPVRTARQLASYTTLANFVNIPECFYGKFRFFYYYKVHFKSYNRHQKIEVPLVRKAKCIRGFILCSHCVFEPHTRQPTVYHKFSRMASESFMINIKVSP